MPTLSQSAAKIVRIMEAVSRHPSGVRVADVAQELGLNRSTVHRLIATLARDSWVTRVGNTAMFTLGPGFLAFCQRAVTGTNILSTLRTFARELTEASGETTHVGILLNFKVVHVLQARSTRQLGIASDVGAVDEAYCTSLGKALLARCSEAVLAHYLDVTPLVRRTPNTIVERRRFVDEIARVRAAGYALDQEESSPGVVCLGVGICGNTPETAIAMSTTGPSSRFSVRRAISLAPKAREVARRAAAALAG